MKEYKGKKYAVSCRQLGTPENKADSYIAANQWWRDKQAELDAANAPAPRVPMPLEDVAAASLGVSADLFGGIRELLSAALLREESERKAGASMPTALPGIGADYTGPVEIAIDDAREDAETIRRREVMALLEQLLFGEPRLPQSVAEQLPPARVHQIESGARAILSADSTPADRSVKALSERWQSIQLARVAAGSLAPDYADNNRYALVHFIGWVGESAEVSTIDAERVEQFYVWCLGREWSVVYARKVFAAARVFIRWLWESNLIELPRNIDSRSFRFGSGAKRIPVWETNEVISVIDAAPGQLKLHLLLMLNCGFTQQDISDLKDSEIDWAAGRIDRTRSKMQDRGGYNVSYKLWPLTWELLKKYRSGGETVLLTESGRLFVRKEFVDGRYTKADNIRSNYSHLRKRLGLKTSLKAFRKTGATLLDKFDPSGRISTLYLGHAPRSMKDRHYSRPDQERFDNATRWLGSQFGFVDAPAG